MMTVYNVEPGGSVDSSSDRYMIVSTDSHAGPRVRDQLREYCPAGNLDDYDEFVRRWEARARRTPWEPDGRFQAAFPFTDKVRQRTVEITDTAGVYDPKARLADMDAEGVAAEVIYHGAMTPDEIPFGDEENLQLRKVGIQMYNRWLADFCSVAPNRLIGAAHLPIWDIDACIKEVTTSAGAGLRCINFPAPNREYVPYNDRAWEPFWAAVAETNLPLTTHGGSGDHPPYTGRSRGRSTCGICSISRDEAFTT